MRSTRGDRERSTRICGRRCSTAFGTSCGAIGGARRRASSMRTPGTWRLSIELAIGGEITECYERALSALSARDRDAIVGGSRWATVRGAGGGPRKAKPEAARKAAARALIKLAERMGRDGV